MHHLLRASISLAIVAWLAFGLAIAPAAAKDKKKPKPDSNKTESTDAKAKDSASSESSADSTVSHGKTHTVARGPFKHQVELDATVAATNSTVVSIQPDEAAQLTIRDVVPHGSRVMKGQPLIKFDTTKLDEQIRDLEAAKSLAELGLKQARLEAELIAKTAPLDAELAERSKRHADEDLARFEKTDRPFQEKSSAFSVTQFSNFLEYVQEELKQLEKMYKADDLTEETEEIVLKRARNDVEQMKHFVEMAKYGHDRDTQVEIPRSLANFQHAAAQHALLAEKSRVSMPHLIDKEKLEVEKLQFEQRKATDHLDRLKRDRDKLTVTAPSDGILYYGRWHANKWTGSSDVSQKLHVGSQIQPHDLVLTVVQSGPLEVQAIVPEKELASVTTGTAGNLHPKASPDQKFAVKVQKVSAAPQSEGEFGAIFSIEGQPPEKLVAGMTGKVKIVAYFKADAIAVPVKAVFHDDADDDKRYVLVVDKDGKHQRRDVTVGRTTEKSTEITAGLSAGDKILLEKPDADVTEESKGGESS